VGEMQYLLINISGLAVTYFVPAVVWVVLMAGIFQLVREKTRHVRLMPHRFRRLGREGYSQQAG
jgi:hypothetical protein